MRSTKKHPATPQPSAHRDYVTSREMVMQSARGQIWAAVLVPLMMAPIGCGKSPEKGPYGTDRRAGLVEVMPPAAMQQSPAAITLIDRMIHRQMQLLQA